MYPITFRLLVAYSTVSVFIVFFFFSSIIKHATDGLVHFGLKGNKDDVPDFSKYRDIETLAAPQFPIDDPEKRVVIVGDIHGMYQEFQALLSKLSYDPRVDTLISVGDIVAKGPLEGSLDVLSFMSSHNITAVRGNHDQKVIEWKSWIDWIQSFLDGKEWLGDLYAKFLHAQNSLPPDDEINVADWVKAEMTKDRKKRDKGYMRWWKTIPDGWKLFEDHFMIAQRMSKEDYEYLLSRPLQLHIPHAHVFIAHAGILASNPGLKLHDAEQPLANRPVFPNSAQQYSKDKQSVLRAVQEQSVLKQIPQNRDPWVTLNMRGVLKDKAVTKGKHGTPWSEVYTHDISLCDGFDHNLAQSSNKGEKALPCMPFTTIYGHAAARGLDIKRWTIGLDSGCVYERRLSSLVLGGKYARTSQEMALGIADEEDNSDLLESSDEDADVYGAYNIHEQKLPSVIRFGDHGRGRIVSVPCPISE